MSREIKFRAWDKRYKQMQVLYLTDRLVSEALIVAGTTNTLQRNEELSDWMQYTGLKDKNGVEIYEGDIVEIQQPASTERGGISFIESAFAFTSRVYPNGERVIVFLHSVKYQNDWKLEVIGNIYENPELLK